MKIEFDVKLTIKDLYMFNLGQAYKGMQGFVSLIIPALIFACAAYTWNSVSIEKNFINLGIGVLILLYVPVSLYLRSVKVIKTDAVLSKSLHYEVSEEGIHVSQGEASAQLEWNQIYRMVAKGNKALIYTNRINAYIIPKSQMEDQWDALIQLAKMKLETFRLKA